jgi:3-hydroxyisobutyrate dehydrogenase-like beta-hydroxyacid dehydrogenase
MKTLGFIGVGDMGNPMAKRLLLAGFTVTVYDVHKQASQNLIDMGAKKASHLKECVHNEAIIVMVANDKQVEDVVAGPEGILEHSLPNKHPIVVVMSTVLPETVRRLAKVCAERGMDVIDAPVSGMRVAAEQGSLTIMTGGSTEAIQTVMPALSAMGKNIYHLGDVGTGCVAKLVNNIMGLTNMFLVVEALNLGMKNGLSVEMALSVIEKSSGSNFYTRNLKQMKNFYSDFSKEMPAVERLLNLSRKDLECIHGLALASEQDGPLLDGIVNAFKGFNSLYVMNEWQRLTKNI